MPWRQARAFMALPSVWCLKPASWRGGCYRGESSNVAYRRGLALAVLMLHICVEARRGKIAHEGAKRAHNVGWKQCGPSVGMMWSHLLTPTLFSVFLSLFHSSIHLVNTVLTTMNRRHTFDALNPRPTHPLRSSSTSSSATLLRADKKSSSHRDKDRSGSSGKEADKKPSRHADVIDTWDPTGLGSASEFGASPPDTFPC